MLTAINKPEIMGEIKNLSVLLSTFLPTVVLVSVAALMPALVGRCESFVRHWTRSTLNRSVMKKTLLLMLLAFLILPSLGLTSLETAFEWVHNGNDTMRWQCIFLPDRYTLVSENLSFFTPFTSFPCPEYSICTSFLIIVGINILTASFTSFKVTVFNNICAF